MYMKYFFTLKTDVLRDMWFQRWLCEIPDCIDIMMMNWNDSDIDISILTFGYFSFLIVILLVIEILK